MSCKSFIAALSVVVLCCALSVPVAGQNKLTNGGFETGSLTGWTNWGAGEVDLFDGVFNNTWNNPPATGCGGISTFGPYGGTYYLGRYKPQPGPCAGGLSNSLGAVFQTVTGLTPGTELYAQAFFASHHPHSGGADVRIGLDPDYVQPAPPDQGTPSSSTVWAPELWPTGTPRFDYSESAYKKLETAKAVVGASGNMTVWVQYEMTGNNVTEAQIVQVDDVRMATTHGMEVKNVDVLGASATVATISWETYDGVNQLATNGQVDYGTSTAYLLGTKFDATLRFNHSVNLTGLSAGSTYYFRIVNKLSGTPGYEDGVYTGTFVHRVGPKIINLAVGSITTNSAVVSWDTVDPTSLNPVVTDGSVDYGITDGYGLTMIDPAVPASHHAVTLTGLYSGQSYYYRVLSCGTGSPPSYGCKLAAGSSPFSTLPGPFWNGDFEVVLKQPQQASDTPPGWTKVDDERWFPSGQWAITAGHGSLYVGTVVSGGRGIGHLYQRFTTTAGDLLSYSSLVYSETTGSGDPCGSFPHRFGEAYCRIGIDPTGGTNKSAASVVWSAMRSTLDWRNHMAAGDCSIHCPGTGWQKISTVTKAAGPYATIFLDGYEYYGGGWNFMCFDNVKPEPVNEVSSVGAAKTLANDTPINLAGATADQSPVVTYIDYNGDVTDNNGKPYFYIEDVSRPAGIKVTMADGSDLPEWLAVGKKVNVLGLISWGHMENRVLGLRTDQQLRLDKPCGERIIRAVTVTNTGATGTIKPLGIGNRGIAGGSSSDHWFTNPGVPDGYGENTVGLLARTWGKIVATSNPGGSDCWIRIDDGSAVPGYSGPGYNGPPYPGFTGLYVPTGSMDYSGSLNKYVVVTGISCVKNDYDWDDPFYVPGITMPEANVNVRYFKPLSYEAPDIVVLP